MRRFLKSLGHGEKGLTLIELLIIVAILGILAAVIIPNVIAFIGAGNLAAANTEAANVRTAAMAYYADHNGVWPPDDTYLCCGGTVEYLDKAADGNYDFDAYGKIAATTTAGSGITNGLSFNYTAQQWYRP